MRRSLLYVCLWVLAQVVFPIVQCVHAATYDVPDTNIRLTYTYSSNEGALEVTITDCNADALGYLAIPATIADVQVTSIGIEAFAGSSSLVNITVPEGVTSIGHLAFADSGSLININIPDSVTSIGNYPFRDCGSLVNIAVGDGNPNYSSKDGILYDKDGATLIRCPEGKSGVCVIPVGVTDILVYAFRSCGSLTSITIPDSVMSIGVKAFYNCSSLTSITIPHSVTHIAAGAFRDCSSLASIVVDDANSSYSSMDGLLYDKVGATLIRCPEGKSGVCVIPVGVTDIGGYAFRNCGSLTSITIPVGVTSISSGAFAYCSSLASITIPDGVTDIGGHAFQNCGSLTSITIPDGVISISSGAFAYCSSLASVTIPNSVRGIDNSAFLDCNSLASLIFQGDAPSVFGSGGFSAQAIGATIYFYQGATGFTEPTWSGLPSQMIDSTTYSAATWLLESGFAYDTSLNQDLNDDGVELLLAYALNLNPHEQLAGKLPKPNVMNGGSFGIHYFAGRLDVSYSVECSSNLSGWTAEGVSTSAPDEHGYVNASVEMEGNRKLFLRLLVEEL